MAVTQDEVRHVARLARLDLTDEEISKYVAEFNTCLDHFEDISEVDVEGVEPLVHAVSVSNVWRDDEPAAGLSREQALSGAEHSKAGIFIVPAILEDES